MANTKVIGNAAVITSTLKLADIKKIEKSTRKDVLTLKGGEDGKTPIFMVGTTTYGTGNINACGAEFACASRDGDPVLTAINEEHDALIESIEG